MKNQQGLSVHEKFCVQAPHNRSEKPKKKLSDYVNTSMQAPTTPSVDDVIQSDVRGALNTLLRKVEGLHAKANQSAGKKHHVYTSQFKAEVHQIKHNLL